MLVKVTEGGSISVPGAVLAGIVVDLLVKSSLLLVGPTAAGAFRGPLRSVPAGARIKTLSSPPVPVPVLVPALSTPSVVGLATPLVGPGPTEPSSLKLLGVWSPDSS